MNVIVGIIFLLVCVFISYVLSCKYSDKTKFYQDFVAFNNKVISEISFSLNSIPKIIKNSSNDSPFYLVVADFVNNNSFNCNYKFLKESDKEYVKSYLDNIGKSDRETQLQYFKNINEELSNRVIDAKEDEKKYKSLFIKVGFLIGLIAFIIVL